MFKAFCLKLTEVCIRSSPHRDRVNQHSTQMLCVWCLREDMQQNVLTSGTTESGSSTTILLLTMLCHAGMCDQKQHNSCPPPTILPKPSPV